MPLYRYECRACGTEAEVLHSIAEPGPDACHLCGGALRRLMPRRVRGVVLEPGQAQAEQAAEARHEAARLRSMDRSAPDPGPLAIPAASWSGPPRDRADRDARYRDTAEALASWQTRSLVADGVPYEQAKRKAEKHQQQVVAQAEAADAST